MILLLLQGRESAQVVALALTLFLEQWVALESTLFLGQWIVLGLGSVPEFVLAPVVVPDYNCSPSVVPHDHECVHVVREVETLLDCIVLLAVVR